MPRLVEPTHPCRLGLHHGYPSLLRLKGGRQVVVNTTRRWLSKRRLLITERWLVTCRLGLHGGERS